MSEECDLEISEKHLSTSGSENWNHFSQGYAQVRLHPRTARHQDRASKAQAVDWQSLRSQLSMRKYRRAHTRTRTRTHLLAAFDSHAGKHWHLIIYFYIFPNRNATHVFISLIVKYMWKVLRHSHYVWTQRTIFHSVEKWIILACFSNITCITVTGPKQVTCGPCL